MFYISGYYGDALSDRKEDGCKLCQCYPPGTLEHDDGRIAPCDQLTGHCACKPHVIGRNCDKCEEGYYHIMSGEVRSAKLGQKHKYNLITTDNNELLNY